MLPNEAFYLPFSSHLTLATLCHRSLYTNRCIPKRQSGNKVTAIRTTKKIISNFIQKEKMCTEFNKIYFCSSISVTKLSKVTFYRNVRIANTVAAVCLQKLKTRKKKKIPSDEASESQNCLCWKGLLNNDCMNKITGCKLEVIQNHGLRLPCFHLSQYLQLSPHFHHL